MKIKNFMLIWFLTMFAVLSAPSAMADTTVVGTGDPEVDVPAVQEAVNAGGTVILKGKFQFDGYSEGFWGYFGYVDVLDSVEIVGENARIYGGVDPFFVDAEGYDVTIRGSDYKKGLTFENPLWAAIAVKAGASIEIVNVNIKGVRTFEDEPFFNEKLGITTFTDGESPHLIPCRIGRLSIVDCNIDIGNNNDPPEQGKGINVSGVGTPGNEVDILIEGNTVRNCSYFGIALNDIAGTLTVENNIVRLGNKAVNPMWGGAIGIFTHQRDIDAFEYDDLPGGLKRYQYNWVMVATIIDNDVQCETGSSAFGVIAFHQVDTVIAYNYIRVDNGFACILVFQESDGFTLRDNSCSGSHMVYGIRVAPLVQNCEIKRNDLTKAKPLNSQISIAPYSHHHLLEDNEIGPPGASGGIYCDGSYNLIDNTTFHGNYPGWTTGAGFIWLAGNSSDNDVLDMEQAKTKKGDDDFDICDQVLDEGADNDIEGYEDCP